jgi:hypothetical protein
MAARGAVAERLGRGLQSLVQRFESARRLLGYGLDRVPQDNRSRVTLRVQGATTTVTNVP